jgi:ferric-dicitrate binding protein FerR (iron transport regulator)
MTTEWNSDQVAQAVAALIHAGGRREAPPPESYDRVLAAAQATWRHKVRRRRWWRIASGLAAAALLVTMSAVLLTTQRPLTATVEVARVDRIIGGADTRAPGADSWAPLAGAAAALQVGTRLRTRENGVAGLTLRGGVSLRLAPLTEVELESDARVRLSHGLLYADTGPGDGGTINVITPAGTAHDFGTQFEIRYEHERLRLRVREGRVALLRDAQRVVADAGTQVAVNAAGEVSRTTIAPSDPAWRWAEAVAPAPDFDGQPVSLLLEWVARETGRALRYTDDSVKRQASATILHGKVGPLAPFEALDVMLATTDFAYEIRDDSTIEVRHK